MKNLDQINLPDGIRYAASHEWFAAGTGRVGVDDYAQDQLGELTFVELPAVGQTVEKGAEFGTLESSKSVGSLLAPVGGTIRAVNAALEDDPGLVNRDPYGEGWIVEIATTESGGDLLDAMAYRAHLESL